jgi:hypothetical protein
MNIGDYVTSSICPNMSGQIIQKFDGRKAIVMVKKKAIMADLKYLVKKG